MKFYGNLAKLLTLTFYVKTVFVCWAILQPDQNKTFFVKTADLGRIAKVSSFVNQNDSKC